jgi:hypothetical protein
MWCGGKCRVPSRSCPLPRADAPARVVVCGCLWTWDLISPIPGAACSPYWPLVDRPRHVTLPVPPVRGPSRPFSVTSPFVARGDPWVAPPRSAQGVGRRGERAATRSTPPPSAGIVGPSRRRRPPRRPREASRRVIAWPAPAARGIVEDRARRQTAPAAITRTALPWPRCPPERPSMSGVFSRTL